MDSEINALFQLIKPFSRQAIDKVYLTASGGALADCTKKDLANITVEKVLAHPTWKMGKRVTVDSATLVNKGFEVIESHFFFDLAYDNIDIVIHKQSMVHAFIESEDNTLFACIYPPDMKVPIAHALFYPKRINKGVNKYFKENFSYTFAPINYKKYPLLKIVLDAAAREDNSLVILNACDETAIDYFLDKKIRFNDIGKAMRHIFSHYPAKKIKTIEDVFFWDEWARCKTKEYLKQ